MKSGVLGRRSFYLRSLAQTKVCERGDMMIGCALGEAAKCDIGDAAVRGRQFRRHRTNGDARGAICREPIDTGRYRREGDRSEPMFASKIERRAVTAGEQLVLPPSAAAPDRADGMDHVLGRQPIAP